jgi:hypothetical protein
MTHDEMIAVIQAHKDGKDIELRSVGGKYWRDMAVSTFDFTALQYRVKPPQIEVWATVRDGVIDSISADYNTALTSGNRLIPRDIIRLIPDPNYTQSPVSDNE